MKRNIANASKHTFKSILHILNMVIMLVFAVVCVVTGQVRKVDRQCSQTDNRSIYQGIVKNVIDSSAISGIRVMLFQVEYPVYGIGLPPWFKPVDTTHGDQNGKFIIDYSGNINHYAFDLKDVDGNENGLFQNDTSEIYRVKPDTTVFTLYMKPLVSAVKQQNIQKPVNSVLTPIQGKNILIRIANWQPGNNASAKIVNIKGTVINTLTVAANGTSQWNTASVPCGVYFLQLQTENKYLNYKIILK